MKEIERTIDYLMANDNHDGLEAELADDLHALMTRTKSVLRDTQYVLEGSSGFDNNISDGDEEVMATWNKGGFGYETHAKILALLSDGT